MLVKAELFLFWYFSFPPLHIILKFKQNIAFWDRGEAFRKFL
jgi:hypothetical protein